MDNDTWKRVERLFDQAIERTPSERSRFLAEACGGDQALRRQVESLLEHHTRTGNLFGTARELADDLLRASTEDPLEGRSLGPYRIEREIGIGGMGRVFLAQREDLPKRVALKLVREPLASPDRIARFRLEQRVLAGLDHPHIAQLLDAGVTDDGAPYFAMEYVDGEPLTTFCDRRRLTVAERLRLFLDVCGAVRYAHAHLVVHRDVKPSNILVSDDGRTKLLDFGVAKLLTPAGGDDPSRTSTRVFTPNYASPEQFTGDPVTTSTDVYQLGALLYELLVGRPPLDVAGKTPGEAERIVREQEPVPPSTAVAKESSAATSDDASSRQAPAAIGANRSTSPERLRQRLKGDVDTIVLKALEKRPERRYTSVDALAGDVERFLEGRPVRARPATPAYRFKKFVLRNRVAAGIAALVVGYAATATWSAASIARERDRAEREGATASRVSDFLLEVFTRAAPDDTVPGEATALELVQQGAQQVNEELAEEPEIQAAMQEVLGRVYHGFGREDDAEPLLRASLETRMALFGPTSSEVASAKHYLAQVLWGKGDLEGADTLDQQALEVWRRTLNESDERLWETLSDLGTVRHLQGRLDEAEDLLREVVVTARHEHPDGHVLLGGYLNNLANVLFARGDYGGAQALMEEALEIDRRFLPADHPSVALRLDNLAYMALRAEAFPIALERAEEALAMYWRVYGAPHSDMPYAMATIAGASLALGDTARADSTHFASLDLRRSLLGPDHPDLLISYRDLGRYLLRTERAGEAVPYFEEALRLARETRGEEHEAYATALWDLGRSREELGHPEEAEPLLRRAHALHLAALGDDHPLVSDEREHLIEFLRRAGRAEEAAALSPADPDSVLPSP